MSLIPDTATATEHHTGRIVDITDVHPTIRIIKAELENGAHLKFQAGQFVELTFNDCDPRCYSIASTPDQGNILEFHILNMTQGASQYACESLTLGEDIKLLGPLGNNYLRTDEDPILAIAGGVGIVPIKSIVETALRSGVTRPIHLYWGAKTEQELYLAAHFIELGKKHGNFQFIPVLSGISEEDTSYRTGYVGAEAAKDFETLAGFHAYLAGPPVMTEDTVPLLLDKGLAEDHIHSDAFS